MSSGFSGPIVFGPEVSNKSYPYRKGTGMVPSAEWSVFMDDFYGAVTTNLPIGWDAVVIDVGATVVTDTTVGAGHGNGALLFDSDGATEGAAVYGEKSIQLTAGKKFWMEMRFKTEIADDSDVQFGLTSLTATTNPEDLWTTVATDVAAFGVLDGDATVVLLADKSNTGTAVVTGTVDLVSATWHTLGLAYNGTALQGYVDGQLAVSTTTTIPTGVVLAPFFGFRNGSAATTEGQIDYIRWVAER
jgi:hypothetical protein